MNKRKKATSEMAIRNAKPESKQYKMGAGHGMYLLVMPNGSKLWRLKYRIDGVEKGKSLGAYPEVSLAEAREKRDYMRKLIKQGVDLNSVTPIVAKVEFEDLITFHYVAERWYRSNTIESANPWAPRTAKKARLYLDNVLINALGDKPIKDITRPELIDLCMSIENRGTFDVARKIREWLNVIFDEAFNRGEIPNNPASNLRASSRAKSVKVKHHPTVGFEELANLLKAVDDSRTAMANKLAIRVYLLTAVRPGELREATWDEFDFNKRTWRIPANRMKMKETHHVWLTDQALDALDKLKLLAGDSQYVLPNRKGGIISDATINKAFRDAGYDGKAKPRQTAHGFRHLISTELNERGYKSDWIEAQLAHKVTNVRGVYNHAVYLPQRAEMMQEWADLIDSKVSNLILEF